MYSYLIFEIIFIFSNRYLYILVIKFKSLFIKNNHYKKSEEEEATFFVSLPTNDYKLYTSLPKDFKIVYDFKNFLFPHFEGLKVYYKNDNEKKLVFYLKINFEKLNNLENKDKILSMLMSKEYQRELKQEICRKLRERSPKI